MTLPKKMMMMVLVPLLSTQAGCTALVGGAIRHTKATAASFEKVSFASSIEVVRDHVAKTLGAMGTVTSDDKQTVCLDTDRLYKYTVDVQSTETGADTVVSVRVEMVGDWEKVGWTTTKEKSKAFVSSLAASLGTAPVSLAAR